MDAKTWASVKDIFSGTVDLAADERRRKLDEICGGDQELRFQVEILLASNDEVANFIEEPAFTVADALPTESEPTINKLIGHYRVVREIGRGGMGTVFLATRDDGEFQQEVAIKVVSSAFLGRESLRRFRQERQILAGLNHPNIARLLDGGVTDDGLPFLIMEYVEGDTLIEYADKRGLSINERLYLFLKICRAFAYAHSNLIVHRDIKPSNILVTVDGEPKLLDFGLAKILDFENDSIRTVTNFRALTPAYASPEQIRGETITTASDIYSLGVVLYELLTGERPFNYDSITFEKMIEIVSGSEPRLPSDAVTRRHGDAVEKNDNTKVSASELRGDIDNIVLMAMRSEPERRYRSVEQFANDIERHLEGLPIIATEDTFSYRTSKFIKRHRIGVSSVALIVLVLIAGIVTTTWQARAARRAQARSETIGAFLQSILGSAAPEAKGSDVKVKDVLADAARRARTELADDPQAMAEVLMTLGKTYVSLTLNEQAETELRAAVAASERANGELHPVTASSLAWLGMALGFQGKSIEGLTVSQRSVDISRTLYPKGHEDLGYGLYALALNLMQKGDSAAALPQAQEASEVIRRSLGENHGYYLATVNEIGLINDNLGRVDEAETSFRQALALGDGLDKRYRIYLAQAGTYLAKIQIRKGQTAVAESQLRSSMAIYVEVLGNSNPTIAYIKLLLGKIYIQQREFNRATDECRAALDMFSESLPPENAFVIQTKAALGLALIRAGNMDEGVRHLLEAQTVAKLSQKNDNPLTAEIESSLGEYLIAKRQFAEAETLLLRALSVEQTAPNNHILNETKQRLSNLYKATNRPAEAKQYE